MSDASLFCHRYAGMRVCSPSNMSSDLNDWIGATPRTTYMNVGEHYREEI